MTLPPPDEFGNYHLSPAKHGPKLYRSQHKTKRGDVRTTWLIYFGAEKGFHWHQVAGKKRLARYRFPQDALEEYELVYSTAIGAREGPALSMSR